MSVDWRVNSGTELIEGHPYLSVDLAIKPTFRVEWVNFRFLGEYYHLKENPSDYVEYIYKEIVKNPDTCELEFPGLSQRINGFVQNFLHTGRWYEEEQIVEKTRYRNLPLLICDLETKIGRNALEKRLKECV